MKIITTYGEPASVDASVPTSERLKPLEWMLCTRKHPFDDAPTEIFVMRAYAPGGETFLVLETDGRGGVCWDTLETINSYFKFVGPMRPTDSITFRGE